MKHLYASETPLCKSTIQVEKKKLKAFLLEGEKYLRISTPPVISGRALCALCAYTT